MVLVLFLPNFNKGFSKMISKALNIAKRVSGYIVAKYMHFKTDAYIISHPKSGRNWLRVLIGKTLCEKFNIPDEIMLDIYKVTSLAGILRTQVIHDHSSYTEGYKYYYLPTDKREYARKKVIFLVRNFTGSISDFIRSDKYGVNNIINFYNIWYENRTIPKEFLLLRYEEMHKNTEEVLARTLKFLGLDEVDYHIIRKAVKFASFSNMKKMEKDNFFKRKAIRPVNINDDDSYKVRRGIVGGYYNYLSEEDIKYIDQVIKERGCPFEQI